ncbi:hypothetical protein [Haladaptatus halobius]|uniref:hypothetical protein n=1 Tax=Haladaptatus halobius TaxID=2884875 RepID=UPI001D0B0DBF|nr:hypothetical protein [Haladaptatus halobius]
MSSEQLEAFSYDGLLVFNGLYTTNVLDANFDFDQVIEEDLTDFSKGSIERPGRGYRVLPFADFVSDDPEIGRQIKDLLGDVHALRHLEEKWELRETIRDGTTEQVPTIRERSSFDVYWAFPDYLFIRADKTKAETAGELLSLTLDEYLSMNEIEFDPDFLLWLFAKEKNSEGLPGNLSINMLTDAEIRGSEPDLLGQRSKVDDSTDITKSALVLINVLQQKAFVALEGVFGLSDKFVRARVSNDGRVHVKADHAIHGSSDIERMAISIAFLREFTSLYESWKGLDDEYRLPPLEFLTDIYEECKRQGVEVTFSIDSVIEEYRQKGSSENYSDYQSGFDDFTE